MTPAPASMKVTFAPVKELIVHEAVEISYEDLLRERVTPAGTMPLYWCSGILFTFSSVPMTRDIVRDYLDGKIHWMEAHYTSMRDYQPVLEFNDDQYKSMGAYKVRVIDTSKSALHAEFVKWLKKRN